MFASALILTQLLGGIPKATTDPSSQRQPIAATTAVSASSSSASPLLKAVLKHAQPSTAQARERIAEVFRDGDLLLGVLPLDDLDRVVATNSHLDFHFDYDGDSSRTVTLPSFELHVLKKGKRGKTKVRLNATDRRKLVISRKIRFFYKDGEISGIREGDLRIKVSFFKVDLKISTRTSKPELVKDEDGFQAIRVDKKKRPILTDGKFVFRTATHWLVLEARGDKYSLPLNG